MEKKYLYDLDAMKAVTILLVVFAHTTRMFTPVGVIKITMQSEVLTLITDFIYMFHMPAFVAITGAVYYFIKREKGKYNEQKKFVVNKAARLLIPYLFFAVAVVLPTVLYTGVADDVGRFIVENVLLFSGPNHLWYSVMIFNIFWLFNLLESRIYSNHFLVNVFVFLMLYGTSVFAPTYFQLNGTVAYIIYFYLGYAFQKNKEKLKGIIASNIALAGAVVLTLVLFYLLEFVVGGASFVIRVPLRIAGATLGTLMLYLISAKLSDTELGNNKVIRNLAKDSYGIFLFHPMIIYILFYWLNDKFYNPYIVNTVVFLVSLILSILLVKVFRRLGIQILIGEKSQPKRNLVAKQN